MERIEKLGVYASCCFLEIILATSGERLPSIVSQAISGECCRCMRPVSVKAWNMNNFRCILEHAASNDASPRAETTVRVEGMSRVVDDEDYVTL